MAVLLTSRSFSLASHPNSTSGRATDSRKFSGSCCTSIAWQTKSYIGGRIHTPFRVNNKDLFVVKVSSEVDGTDSTTPSSPPPPPSDGNQESIPVENLPLESKLDQKMKMKIAKKIRLRRKRLVRKRHLRKKGRWPPSKLKKNKNV